MLLLHVGRLAREKNVRQLLSMMDHLSDEKGIFQLMVVGDGELRSHVAAIAHRRKDVPWLPYCKSSDRLACLYSAADLFVHAGTAETFGLVSVESQTCGTRVLAVRGGGLEDTLVGEEPCVMAQSASPSALAAAVRVIRRLGEGEEERTKRRERVVRAYSWIGTYHRLTALCKDLCQKTPPGHYGLNGRGA